jgi:hypothetical protein
MQGRGKRNWRWIAILMAVVALPFPVVAQSVTDTAAEVVVRALGLVDVPYRYGGRTPAGFDCSGFVGYIFGESTGMSLPRRSEEIGRVGASLNRRELAPGDLVFFNTLGRLYSHVGIYIGEGQFVHAPARRGRVRVDRLADPYWTVRYNGARRVAGTAPAEVAAAAATARPEGAFDASPEARVTP